MGIRFSIAFGLAAAGLLLLAGFVLATPALPFSPYGHATVDGAYVAAGTGVYAWCGGTQVRATATRMEDGVSWYVNLDVPGDDPGTPGVREGCYLSETVTFRVGTYWSDQAFPWTSSAPAITLTAFSTPHPAPVMPNLAIARSGAAVRLSWSDNVANKSYEVWRSTAPYLSPGATDTSIIANAPSNCVREGGAIICEDSGVIGNPSTNYFYLVRAGNATNASVDSRRVGEFDFALTPGN
jgi:hypothetical protein